MEDYYPWFLDTYDALPLPIMKADAVRICYMHLYGGEHPHNSPRQSSLPVVLQGAETALLQ